MKNITSDYKNEVKLFGRQIDSKITYELNGETIELGKSELNSVSPHYESDILKSTMKQLDIDSNVEIPLNTILNYQFGVLVNNQYEYINYGNYVVYKAEKQEDTKSWKITCYDKMLYSMKDYVNIGVTYPITIRDYINAICEYLGLVFKNKNDEFANYDKEIQNELYLNNAGESLGYTFRDVFDELAQVTASTICINENDDELEIRYINDLINETNEIEGTNISIDDNVGDKLLDLELKGDTKQDGTPTPDSPVNIDVVTGRQEISMTGKNLFDKDNVNALNNVFINGNGVLTSGGANTTIYVPCNPSTTYTISKVADNVFRVGTSQNIPDINTTLSNYTDNASGTSITITTSSTANYLSIFLRNASSTKTLEEIYNSLQIELGSATSYEPYKGNTYEVNLGKNLFDKNNITTGKRLYYWQGTATLIDDANYCVSDYIKIKPNATYTINLTMSAYTRMIFFDNNKNPLSANETNATFTTPNNTAYVRLSVPLNQLDTTQLEKGSQATSYSPYFTPIELNKIGNYQDYIRKSTGKNLFNKDNYLSANNVFINIAANQINFASNNLSIYMEIKPNTTYTISCGTAPARFRAGSTTDIVTQQTSITNGRNRDSNTSMTLTTGSNDKYLYLNIDSDFDEDTLQIEENTEATNFEPFGKGKWYKYSAIGKIILDGSESYEQPRTNVFATSSGIIKAIKNQCYSNYYTYNPVETNVSSTLTNGEFALQYNSSTQNRLFFKNTSISSVNDFKSWLSTHNTKVYYILATPQVEEITNTELIEQLESIKLLEGVNNITINSENLPSPLKITYITEYESINEEYLKDINVNFGEKYGPVNSIVLSRASESDNVYLRDENSVAQNGLCEIKIKENQIMNFNDRSDYLPDILKKLDGLEYYINDFSSTGITFYEMCDKYRIKIGENTYSCIMFNDETNITQGLEELVHTDMPEGSETDYKKADKTDRKINQTYIIADKQQGQIEALTSQTTTLEDEMRNRYTIDQVNQLIQNAETGVTNTFSEAGGNNIFRNTGLWFENDGQDSQQNPYEYWNGLVVKYKEDNANNNNALLLQNSTLYQEQNIPNGNYTVSFKYKKLIQLATVKCIINDVEYELTNTEETEFIQTLQINSQHIKVQFMSDTNNSCEIYDLMVNAGSVKLAYSQNQNETTTDTVNISKGITITSSDLETTFKANADGIRTLDKNGNRLTEFTDTGMINKTMTVEDEATIVDILIQRVGNHTWMTKI